MGNFCVSAVCSDVSLEDVRKSFAPIQDDNIVCKVDGNWACVVSEGLDEQSTEYIENFGVYFSKSVGKKVITTLNHDDDFLCVTVFDNGVKVASLNTNPAYFSDNDEDLSGGAQISGLSHFLSFVQGEQAKKLTEVLETSGAFDFAYEVQEEIYRLFEIPNGFVGVGHSYVSKGEFGEGWETV